MTTSANAITVPSRAGHEFEGYYTGTNGTGSQYINTSGKLTNNVSNTFFTATGKLYAKWDTCGEGYYSDGTTTTCTKCPKGYTSNDGATSINSCYMKVPAGNSLAAKAEKYAACASGKYRENEVKVYYGNNISCDSCPEGYKTDSTGSTLKTNCSISCEANTRVTKADEKCTGSCGTGYSLSRIS